MLDEFKSFNTFKFIKSRYIMKMIEFSINSFYDSFYYIVIKTFRYVICVKHSTCSNLWWHTNTLVMFLSGWKNEKLFLRHFNIHQFVTSGYSFMLEQIYFIFFYINEFMSDCFNRLRNIMEKYDGGIKGYLLRKRFKIIGMYGNQLVQKQRPASFYRTNCWE